jgi:hypothetical protein
MQALWTPVLRVGMPMAALPVRPEERVWGIGYPLATGMLPEGKRLGHLIVS